MNRVSKSSFVINKLKTGCFSDLLSNLSDNDLISIFDICVSELLLDCDKFDFVCDSLKVEFRDEVIYL